MEENVQADNVATPPVNNEVETESNKDDVVAYSTYSKVLGTLKKREGELNEFKSRLDSIELEKQQADGNKDEVIGTLRKRLEDAEKSKSELQNKYAWNSVEGQISQAASAQGCVNTTKLLKLLDKEDLKSIEVGEDFKVNQDDLNRLIAKAKKDNADIKLFSSKDPQIHDVAPKVIKTKGNNDLSADEIREKLKNL